MEIAPLSYRRLSSLPYRRPPGRQGLATRCGSEDPRYGRSGDLRYVELVVFIRSVVKEARGGDARAAVVPQTFQSAVSPTSRSAGVGHALRV